MTKVGIADLKAHLSGHLRTVKAGATLLVVDRGVPVARIVPAGEAAGGLITRAPARALAESKRMIARLPPLALTTDSLAVLLGDRER